MRGPGDLVGREIIGVPDHQPGRGQEDDREVAPQLVAVEGGLVVHQEGRDRLVGHCQRQRVQHDVRVVPASFDSRAQVAVLGRGGHRKIGHASIVAPTPDGAPLVNRAAAAQVGPSSSADDSA